MRTAQEMVDYCDMYGLGKGMTKTWRFKHFEVVEEQLQPHEVVEICFIGLHNYISATNHNNYFAYAVTQDRMIVAQKKLVGQNLQSINLSNLNDITMSTGILWGVLTFDTFKEKINVAIDKSTISNIHNLLTGYLMTKKQKDANIQAVKQPEPTLSASNNLGAYDELIKCKELLDLGIITKEEFDKKKKELGF